MILVSWLSDLKLSTARRCFGRLRRRVRPSAKRRRLLEAGCRGTPIHTFDAIEERLRLGNVFSISAMFGGTFVAGQMTVLSADQLPVLTTGELELLGNGRKQQSESFEVGLFADSGTHSESVLPERTESATLSRNEGEGTSVVVGPHSSMEFGDGLNSRLTSELNFSKRRGDGMIDLARPTRILKLIIFV